METLKSWMQANWASRGIQLPHVQYLPNNHFVFLFEEVAQAKYVLAQGFWLLRNAPLILQPWFRNFNPRTSKATLFLAWVDFPNLFIHLYPLLNELGNQLGKVREYNPVPTVNPKWDPLLLIEVDN